MSDTGQPLVSVSLVTYNGIRWVDACLDSVIAQTHRPIEVIVLDNGSSDGTPDRVAARAGAGSALKLIRSTENLGFAAAHNRVIDVAKGAFVCLLNQDVILDPGFLAGAVQAFEADPGAAAVQGRLYRLGPGLERTTTFDTTGLQMHRNRRIVSRGQGQEDVGQFDQPGLVFGADGPAPVYRAVALRDVTVPRAGGRTEVLDEDFFMYKEDVDLAWRLLLFGWHAAYVPSAIAWHARGAGASAMSTIGLARERQRLPSWIKCRSWTNQRWMQVKNELAPLVGRDFGHILWKEVRALAFLAAFETRCLSAFPRFVRGLPAARRKRAYVMAHRRRDANEMAAWFDR